VGAVAHLDASGALIQTYANDGIAELPTGLYTSKVEILVGHVVSATGVFWTIDSQGFGASLLLESGAVDLSYGVSGTASADVQQNYFLGLHHAAHDGKNRLLLSSYAHFGGNDFPYRIARLTSSGIADMTFNSSNQQPGTPGVAVLTVSGNELYDLILGAQPLPDGHILVIGGNAAAANTDATYFNISLLRLNEDAGWDTSFGDAAHPGWASINIGGLVSSDGRAYSMALDPRNGRIVAGIGTSDSNGQGCSGLIRVIGDQLFGNAFDGTSPMPTCPQ
jgi:hypothetical protein